MVWSWAQPPTGVVAPVSPPAVCASPMRCDLNAGADTHSTKSYPFAGFCNSAFELAQVREIESSSEVPACHDSFVP